MVRSWTRGNGVARSPIADFNKKVDGMLEAVGSCATTTTSVLALCNAGRVRERHASALKQKVIAEALCISNSNITNWRTTNKIGATPGTIFDFVALLGMAPDQEYLGQLEQQHEEATARRAYPNEVYEMLENWAGGSTAERCWVAFAGSDEQLKKWQLPKGSTKGRGTTGDVFVSLFRQSLTELKPQLLDTAHGAKGLPARALLRRQRSSSPYANEDGPESRSDNSAPLHPAGPPAPLPEWLDRKRGIALFATELPTIGRSHYEVHQKVALYGGRRQSEVRFSPIEHVLAGHTFDRKVVSEMCAVIRTSAAHCSSFTLCARPGGGLSLALAQLVRDLSLHSDTKVLWIVGDAAQTNKALGMLTDQFAEDLVSFALSARLRRLVVVLDDVSSAAENHILGLIRFRQRCKVLAQTHAAFMLSFVFGSFGDVSTCSEDKNFELALPEADQEACYQIMARHEPLIIEDRSGLTEIIKRRPQARWYEDDAQAFIDFLLEYGGPTAYVADHWLARTNHVDGVERQIVGLVAVAQLVGLSIPEDVARTLFSSLRDTPFHDAEEIVQACRGAVVVQDEWRGVGLSCARRARSILTRSGRFQGEFLEQGFSSLLAVALENYETGRIRREDALAFARHIFQRLGKSAFFAFNGKAELAEHFTSTFGSMLARISDDWSLTQRAHWAGTLSGLLTPSGKLSEHARIGQLDCARLVLNLSSRALGNIGVPSGVTTDIAVSVMRAGRRLIDCGLLRDGAALLAEGVLHRFNQAAVLEILESQLTEDSEHRVYRANELIHAYCRLEEAARGSLRARERSDAMSKWLDVVSQVFTRHKAGLDAGNWLQRAQYVWSGNGADRSYAFDLKAQFIEKADQCIDFNPQSQGTWATQARRLRVLLSKKEASFSNSVGVNS